MRVLRAKLAPGMVLEAGAMDRDGRMLIAEGTALSGRMIDLLEIAKIPILYVTDESWRACKTCPDVPPLSEAAQRRLAERFRHVDLEGSFARAVFDECSYIARENASRTGKATGA